MRALSIKQGKEREALRGRLDSLLRDQLKTQAEGQQRLIRKMEAKKRKIELSLTREGHLQSQLETLATSRFISKSPKRGWEGKNAKVCWDNSLKQ
jgi:hypothetical protein